MCFKKSKHWKHKIAEHDIICHKLMVRNERGFRPLFHNNGVTYQLGDTMKPSFDDSYPLSELDEMYVIGAGVIHAWHPYDFCSPIMIELARFAGKDEVDEGEKIVLVWCVVPKGTAYWTNHCNEIIAKKMILKDLDDSEKE